MLTAIERLLLHPVDVPDSESLVRAEVLEPKGMVYTFFPYEVYREFKAQTKALSVTAADAYMDVAVSRGAMPKTAVAHMVSGSYFGVLGPPAALGRTLVPEDDRGDGGTVVLSCGLWWQMFGGSRSALGQSLYLNGQPYTVVGVMPLGFFGTSLDEPAGLWLPLAAEARFSTVPLDSPQSDRQFEILGRLKTGAAPAEAQREFAAVLASFVAAHPDEGVSGERGTVEPLERRATWKQSQISHFLLLLLGAVGLTFVILCANVAGLFVARGARQERETAVRISLGASRMQLWRQHWSESWLLAVLGAALGMGLAWTAAPLLLRFVPVGEGPLPISLRPGVGVAGVLVALALGVSMAVGGAPGWVGRRENLFSALRGGSLGARLGGLSRGLVLAQVALGVMLLFAAGLLLRTLSRLAAADPGFDRDHLAVFTLDTGMSGVRAAPANLADQLVQRVAAIPGVRGAALAAMELMQGRGLVVSIAPAGVLIQRRDFMNTSLNEVSPGYFETLGIPLIAGRRLAAEDGKSKSPIPVVATAAFARFLFPRGEALGRTFGNGKPSETARAKYEIVGIVGDSKYRSLREISPPTFYLPLGQRLDKDSEFVMYVRTAGQPGSTIPAVRSALYSLDRQLPFVKVETMAEELTHSMWQERLLAFLGAVFAGLALLLSATAIYGVLAFELSRRTREIAVRIALGAQSSDVAALVVKDIGATVIVGVGGGLAACAGLGHLLRSYVFGIAPWDGASMAAAVALVLIAALFACLQPTQRAVRVPPALVLREE